MKPFIESPRDLWAGLLYLAVGVGTLFLVRGHVLGTVGRMGPGFFPTILAALLVAFGLLSIARSFIARGESIDTSGFKPLIYLIAGNLLFAALLRPLGLVLSLLVLGIVAASASSMFRWDWRAMLGLLALSGACSVVFSLLLNIPMPLVGHWIAAR